MVEDKLAGFQIGRRVRDNDIRNGSDPSCIGPAFTLCTPSGLFTGVTVLVSKAPILGKGLACGLATA